MGKISVGEDDVNVTLKLSEDLVDVIVLGPVGSTSGMEIILFLGWCGVKSGKGGFHEGVFTHDHVGVDSSKSGSDLTDLFGRNVVSVNEESVVVFSGGLLESSPVSFLLDSLV